MASCMPRSAAMNFLDMVVEGGAGIATVRCELDDQPSYLRAFVCVD